MEFALLLFINLVRGSPVLHEDGYCPNVTCFKVSDAGLPAVNGLYVEREMPGYIGPMSYTMPGTNLWLYRWHQTWWYITNVDSEDFTNPLYASAVVEPAHYPPASGWYHDKMIHPALAPAPVVQPYVCNQCPESGEVREVTKCVDFELEKCFAKDMDEPQARQHSCLPGINLLYGLSVPAMIGVIVGMIICRPDRLRGKPPVAVATPAPEEPRHYAVVQGPGGTHSLAVATSPLPPQAMQA